MRSSRRCRSGASRQAPSVPASGSVQTQRGKIEAALQGLGVQLARPTQVRAARRLLRRKTGVAVELLRRRLGRGHRDLQRDHRALA